MLHCMNPDKIVNPPLFCVLAWLAVIVFWVQFANLTHISLHELDPITYLHTGAMLQLELVAEIDIDVQLVSSIGNISPNLPTCDARVLWTQEDCLPLSFPTTNLVIDNLLYDNFEAGCTPIIGLGVSSVCDRRGCHILDVVASSKDRSCALTSPFFHMGGFCNSSPEVSYCNDYPDGYSDDRHDKFPDEQVAKCTSPYEEPVFSNAGPWAAAALFPANWATAPLYKRLIIEREELEKNIRLWEETLQSLQAKTTNSSNVEGFGPSPDFPYFPSSEAYQKESKRFQKQAQSVRSLPEGFPQAIVSPLAWKTKSPAIKQEKESWTLKLTEEQLKSIGAAVQQYEGWDLNLLYINRSCSLQLIQPLDETSRILALQHSSCIHPPRIIYVTLQRLCTTE